MSRATKLVTQKIIMRLSPHPTSPENLPIITFHSISPFSSLTKSSSQKPKYAPKKPIKLKMLELEIYLESYLDLKAEWPLKKSEKPRFQFSVLQSLVQKAVRRSDEQVALRGAYWMLLQDPERALRRIPIIIMEDAMLHPNLLLLVWLMMSLTRGYPFSERECHWVLSILRDVQRTKYRDPIPYAKDKSKEVPTDDPAQWRTQWINILEGYGLPIQNKQKQFSITPQESEHHLALNCLLGLIIRICYGGMKGDQKFLHKQVVLWSRRFKSHPQEWLDLWKQEFPEDKQSENFEPHFTFTEPPELNRANHQQSYALDFHNFPFLMTRIEEQFPNLSTDAMKDAIWNHRSGLNLRRMVCTRDYEEKPTYPAQMEDPYEKAERQRTLDTWKKIQNYWLQLTGTEWFWRAPVEQPKEDIIADTPSKKRKRDASDAAGKKGKKNRLITDFFRK